MKHFRCVSIAALSLNLVLMASPAIAQRMIMNPAVARQLGSIKQNPSTPTGLPIRFTGGTSFSTGGTSPHGIATGDFNHDGKQDVVVANQDQDNVAVLLGNGDGTLALSRSSTTCLLAFPCNVAVADFNGDGNLDIAVVTGQLYGLTSSVFVLLGNGNGTFGSAITTASGVAGASIHAADVNGDGKEDVVIGGDTINGNGSAAVLYGKGDETFQNPVLLSSASGRLVDAAVADVNGDGRLDLICAVYLPGGIAVFLQNPNGSFSPGQVLQPSGLDGTAIVAGDFNNDGKPDALVVGAVVSGDDSNVFLGNGDGTFQSPLGGFAGINPVYAAVADFNHDGILDAAFANLTDVQYPGPLQVLTGYGDGSLTYWNYEYQQTAGGTSGVAVADFNGDGWPDIVTVDSTGNSATVFLNLIPANLGPQQFVPITPCRLLDSRVGIGGGPISGGFIWNETVAGTGDCGATVPTNASAYSLNVTILPTESFSYMQMWQAGAPLPPVSILNSLDGRPRANALIVAAGNNGGLFTYLQDTANLLIDINGYFIPASQSTLAFYPVTPCRVFDTRNGNGPLGGPYLQGGVERDFPVLASNCNIPSDAQAYSMNFTAVPYSGDDLGYLTVWGKGSQQPGVSTLNNPTATVVANGAIVQAGTEGEISVYASGNTQLVGDINGYFAPAKPGGLSLYTLQPCRAFDTRQQNLAFDGEITVGIATSPCAPPSTAQAYALNATAIPDPTLNYLTLWPDGESQPTVSTLNAVDGTITSNMAIVGTTNGSIDAYASGLTNLILDLYGYFAP